MHCAPKPLHGDPRDVRTALRNAPIVPLFLSSPGLVALPSGPTVLMEHQRALQAAAGTRLFQCCPQRPLMPTAAPGLGVFLPQTGALFPVTFVTPPFCVSSPP